MDTPVWNAPRASRSEAAADSQLVQKEKRRDEAAREKLAEHYGCRYGGARRVGLHSRRTGWKCPQCAAVSTDVRRVCGNCLAPEPGVLRSPAELVAALNTASRGRGAPLKGVVVPVVRQPGVSFDVDYGIASVAGRSYRCALDSPGCAVGGRPDAPLKPPWRAAASASALAATSSKPHRGYAPDFGASDDPGDDEPACDGGDSRPRASAGGAEDDGWETVPAGLAVAGPSSPVAVVPTGSSCDRTPQPFTHFVAVPVVVVAAAPRSRSSTDPWASVVANAAERAVRERAEVLLGRLRSASCRREADVDESIVNRVDKLHFTMQMLCLDTEAKRQEAIRRLGQLGCDLKAEFAAASPAIRLKGLRVMAGKPATCAHIVYMSCADQPSEDVLHRVQRCVHRLFAPFTTAQQLQRSTLLHMTLMNTKWQRAPPRTQRGGGRTTFDATAILRDHRDADLGELPLRFVCLYRCGNGTGGGEEYVCDGLVEF